MTVKYMQLAKEIVKNFGLKGNFAYAAGAGKCRPVHAEEGNIRVEFEVEKDQTNHFETLHGGCTSTLIDNYTTAALLLTQQARPGVSVDLHITYLTAAKIGETLVLDSTVTKQGKTLAFTKAELYRKRDNVMIATGVHTKAFPSIAAKPVKKPE